MRSIIAMWLVLFVASSWADDSAAEVLSKTSDQKSEPNADAKPKKIEKIRKTDAQWRRQLSRKQFDVTRRGTTETARTGRYWRHKEKGTYLCVCCDLDLFSSKTKYKSGTGWPSFYAPLVKEHIAQRVDRKLFYSRVEVLCKRCDAHLGHVFNDGPKPTGLRYCLNSAALKFESDEDRAKKLKAKKDEAAKAKSTVEEPE